jgi:hypothetical protein
MDDELRRSYRAFLVLRDFLDLMHDLKSTRRQADCGFCIYLWGLVTHDALALRSA